MLSNKNIIVTGVGKGLGYDLLKKIVSYNGFVYGITRSAKDLLITSQLRTALILNKNVKATNYQIDTYKKKIYVYGIALTSDEKDLVISEAKEILDVENVIASIILVEDLRIQKD